MLCWIDYKETELVEYFKKFWKISISAAVLYHKSFEYAFIEFPGVGTL